MQSAFQVSCVSCYKATQHHMRNVTVPMLTSDVSSSGKEFSSIQCPVPLITGGEREARTVGPRPRGHTASRTCDEAGRGVTKLKTLFARVRPSSPALPSLPFPLDLGQIRDGFGHRQRRVFERIKKKKRKEKWKCGKPSGGRARLCVPHRRKIPLGYAEMRPSCADKSPGRKA